GLQVFLNVVAQGLERGDVQNFSAIGEISGKRRSYQRVDADQKCGQGFSGTSRRGNQRCPSGQNVRPALFLRFGGSPETAHEPFLDQRVGPLQAGQYGLRCNSHRAYPIINDCAASCCPRAVGLVLRFRRNRIARPASLDEGKRRKMASKVVGVDVGTGGTRAVLLDEAGRVLGAATAEHAEMASPELGWAEQDP